MFIRVKSTPNSPRKSVQLVENKRIGSKIQQRIVHHIGIAKDDEALERLLILGEIIKQQTEDERQPGLFPPEQLAEQVARCSAADAALETRQPLPVDLLGIREQQRVVTGFHEIYGEIYRDLGFDRVLSSRRQPKSHRVLYDMVMARIANPDSKRGGVRRLEQDFGLAIALEQVYRMMDHLDEPVIDDIRKRAGTHTRTLFPEPLDVLFFDCTTLYFESFTDDDLKQCGYSKDGKHNQVQVILALMVTRKGLLVSYAVFPGSSWEGHSFLPVLERMRRDFPSAEAVHVADAGMFSNDNLAGLDHADCRYIVGARLRSWPAALTRRVLDTRRYRRLKGSRDGLRVGVFRHKGRRLVVSWSPKRARKDAHDRAKALERLVKRLKKSSNPKSLLGTQGAHRFLRVEGEAELVIDEDRINTAARWDGLHGVITNVRGVPVRELLGRYRGLWEVEESFRITKHDLRVRPVFHWTPRRIHAHLALSFMAFACVRHLAWRVELQKRRLSPEVLRNALQHRQVSVLEDDRTGRRYGVPSKPLTETEMLYQIMGKTLSLVPFEITDSEAEKTP